MHVHMVVSLYDAAQGVAVISTVIAWANGVFPETWTSESHVCGIVKATGNILVHA